MSAEAVSSGFFLGFSLILAIGAQNALVLRQGLRREHVFAISLTCALSDAILIALGVAGFGWIVTAAPMITPLFQYGGAIFLVVYGLIRARAAWRGETGLSAGEGQTLSRAKVVMICLALTWLNPHVYLDTVVLLGSVSTGYDAPWWFGTGAVLSSFVFFFGLGYGARFLNPLFRRPASWRILDAVVALTMWAIALGLILD